MFFQIKRNQGDNTNFIIGPWFVIKPHKCFSAYIYSACLEAVYDCGDICIYGVDDISTKQAKPKKPKMYFAAVIIDKN